MSDFVAALDLPDSMPTVNAADGNAKQRFSANINAGANSDFTTDAPGVYEIVIGNRTSAAGEPGQFILRSGAAGAGGNIYVWAVSRGNTLTRRVRFDEIGTFNISVPAAPACDLNVSVNRISDKLPLS